MTIEFNGKQINEEKFDFKMYSRVEKATNFGNYFVMFCWYTHTGWSILEFEISIFQFLIKLSCHLDKALTENLFVYSHIKISFSCNFFRW